MEEPEPEFQRVVRENVATMNATFHSLGRYFYEFSRTFYWMRTVIGDYLASPGKPAKLTDLLLGQSPAETINSAYFALCFEAADLTASERAIGVALRGRLSDLILKRNDLAHGDLHFGELAMGLPVSRPGNGQGQPRVERIKPTRSLGPFAQVEWSPRALDDQMLLIMETRAYVLEYGDFCLHTHGLDWGDPSVGIEDVFVKHKKTPVERTERFASLMHSFV